MIKAWLWPTKKGSIHNDFWLISLKCILVYCQLSLQYPQCWVIMIILILIHNTFTLASFSFSFFPLKPCLSVLYCSKNHTKIDTIVYIISQFFVSISFLSSSPIFLLLKFQLHIKLDAFLLPFPLSFKEWPTFFVGHFFLYAQCLAYKRNLIHVCGTKLKYSFLTDTQHTISSHPLWPMH